MSKMSNLDLVLDEMITAGQKMIDAATLSIPTVTVESPVDLTTFRRFVMVSPLAVSLELRMILLPKRMTIS